jgi:hypothetical protein
VIEWFLRRVLSRGGPSRDHDPRLLAFVRGAAIGALVGAAFAGSSLWRRSGRRQQAATICPSEPILLASARHLESVGNPQLQ